MEKRKVVQRTETTFENLHEATNALAQENSRDFDRIFNLDASLADNPCKVTIDCTKDAGEFYEAVVTFEYFEKD